MKKNSTAKVILIGCGPHARRIYIPAISTIEHIELALVIELEGQESNVKKSLSNHKESKTLFIKPFKRNVPKKLEQKLAKFISENEISGVIIATEPLVHKAYCIWAVKNKLNILIDKPITARAESTSKLSSANGILEDYTEILNNYNDLQLTKETIVMVNSQRRFHEGFLFVQEKITEVAKLTNCPVTFIQASHSDGQWRLPSEIVSQKYHPYNCGYGKASHSGYHIFDSIYQFYDAAKTEDKSANSMEIVSSFIQPNGFFNQLTNDDYQVIFGKQYNQVNKWTDEELKIICEDYGEIDISSIITLKRDNVAVANFSVNLLHNSFAGRTSLFPGEDLYKGNGRIKHEHYNIQQGPFQNIQIHSYQSSDNHDLKEGLENHLGGKNHFDIYIFRNPLVAGKLEQPSVYKFEDFSNKTELDLDSMLSMEIVKYKVVEEFADYLVGRKKKSDIKSQIDDHIVPMQIMSGIYSYNIKRKKNKSNVVELAYGKLKN